MNNRHRRVMRNMKREYPKRYMWIKANESLKKLGVSTKNALNLFAQFFSKKNRPSNHGTPTKWHKSNKGWR